MVNDSYHWDSLVIHPKEKSGIFRYRKPRSFATRKEKEFQIWVGFSGKGILEFLESQWPVDPGTIIMLPPQVPFKIAGGSDPDFELFYVHFDLLFDGELIENATKYLLKDKRSIQVRSLPPITLTTKIHENTAKELIHWLLLSAKRLHNDVCDLEFRMQIYRVIRYLRLNYIAPNSEELTGNSPLERAIFYMYERLDENLSLDQIAEHAGVSITTLGRLFRSHLKLSPMRYFDELRLTRACELLRSRELNVSEVAYDTGFQSPSFFSRHFKKRYGVSPREYRKKVYNWSDSNPPY